MPRTFTLWQLLLVVTLACVVCGIVTLFPTASILAGLTLTYFIPGLSFGGVLSLMSARPRRALAIALLGAATGFAAAPQNLRIWGDYNLGWWDLYPMFFLSVTTYTTIGALLGAAAVVVFFPRWRRQ
jgi:hypothetical protein